MPRTAIPRADSAEKSIAPVARRWRFSVFSTPLGWVGTLGSGGTLYSLTLGHSTKDDAAEAVQSRFKGMLWYPGVDKPLTAKDWQPALRRKLLRYAEGEQVDFLDVEIGVGARTPFQQRILEATRRIAYGTTLTYGQLAETAGAPGAARAVGSVMRCNSIPLVIPCHRVVASTSLGGYSAPRGIELKRTLLDLESAQPLSPKTVQPARLRRTGVSSL